MPAPEGCFDAILAAVGDQDTQAFGFMVEPMWDARADKGVIGGIELQIEYVKRDVAERLLGQLWQNVTSADGDVKRSYEQQAKAVQGIYANCLAEIIRIEEKLQGGRSPFVGQPIATAPIMPEWCGPFGVNPNSRRLRGDAVLRSWPVEE
jgi:hypothetical protein